MAVRAAALEFPKREDPTVFVGEESVASLAGQRSVLASERKIRALVVESSSHEAFRGMTALAIRLRRRGAAAVPARIVHVFVAGGAAKRKRPEPDGITRPGGKESRLAPMAEAAIHSGVAALKRKARVSLVPEKKRFPPEAARVMARLAATLELAQVDVAMAGDAAGRKRPETHGDSVSSWKSTFLKRVASNAADRPVFSGQWEARLPVIERRLPETLDPVAAGAVRARELAEMGVVRMAVAAPGEGEVLEALAGMTARAAHLPVHAAQWKRGPVVLEAGTERREGGLLVTALAIDAQARPVRVLVAILTAREAKALEARAPVTAPAVDLLVRAPERERRLVVVEGIGPELPLHGMTLEAVLAQLPPVGIVMTGDAAPVLEEIGLRFQPNRSASGAMALSALFDLEVQPQERISGLLMVERFRAEANELHLVSVVLGMAADAIARLPAMKSLARPDPFFQVPVTREAFLRFDALSRAVTAGAVLEAGELGMGATQRTRRDQRVEPLGSGAGCQKHREETRHGPPPLHQEGP